MHSFFFYTKFFSALSPSPSDSALGTLDRSISIPPLQLLTSATGPITDADRKKYEEERATLYQQLDEKDDEITHHSQLAERLKQQLNEQEELIKQIKLDYENAQAEVNRIQSENEASKEETKEVLTALEELAMNYDMKTQEAEQKNRDNEQLGVSDFVLVDLGTQFDDILFEASFCTDISTIFSRLLMSFSFCAEEPGISFRNVLFLFLSLTSKKKVFFLKVFLVFLFIISDKGFFQHLCSFTFIICS